MKKYALLLMLLLGTFPSLANAQGPDDQYFQVYTLIQEGDALNTAGQPAQALAKYRDAQDELRQFQKVNPDWNPDVVKFRLRYLANQIADASAKVPAGTATPPVATPAATPSAVPNQTAETPVALESQIKSLQDQIRELQSSRAALETKLKEALSARPAALDPGELAKAEDQIKSLTKENELLKVNLARQAQQTPPADTKVVDQLKNDLAAANRKLAEQTDLAQKLALEKQALQQASARSPDSQVEALRTANERLRTQLAAAKAAPPAANAADLNRQLADAKKQIVALQSDKEALRLEGIALQGRIKQLMTAQTATTAPPQPGTASNSTQKDLAAQVEILQAQLAVLDAQKVPYTPEELALMKEPAPKLAPNPRSESKHPAALSASATRLLEDAQRDFAAKRYAQAEAKYLEVVKQNNQNVNALANLATVQLELNHIDDAEKHIRQALALAPDDAYSLSILGNLKFREGNYDASLDALSRAAKLDPQNPEIQNFLGLTLSQKGMRNAAEAAFRKAVELDPNYADAQNNLAVFYITQKPPWVELARWHYQKALADGMPRNLELEKMLNQTPTAEGNH